MPPFRYDPYDSSRWTGSIADILRLQGQIPAEAAIRTGQIQAEAARQQGQIWGNAVQGATQAVSSAITQANDPRRKLEVLQANEAQARAADAAQLRRGQQGVDAMMAGDTSPAGAMGPRQDSYLDANGLFDVPKMQHALASSGIGHLAPELLKGAESINDAILKHQTLEQQTNQAHALLLGDLADGALKLHAAGTPLDQAMDFVVQPALATKRIKPDEYAQVKARLMQLPPDQQQAALTSLMDAAAKISPEKDLSKDAQRLDRYNRVTATNVVTEPGKGDYTINGQRFKADGTAIGSVVPPQHTPVPKGLQSESEWQVGGKSTPVLFDPSTGNRYLSGEDFAANTPIDPKTLTKIPPASVTIRNQNAQAPNLPAWALDDSRPVGPESNTPDPATRMTPNGLYQAAQNYIANGQYPPTGRGSDPVALAQREAINAKVGAIAAASGMDLPSLRAFFKSNAASLGQQQKMYDAVQGFMATADKNAVLLQGTLKKLPDLGLPIFNKPLRAFEQDVSGDVNLSQFATYLKSVQNEYARIISQPNLAGQLTDSARGEAQALIDPKATVPQIIASIQALTNEGSNRLVSVGEQIQRIQQRMQTSTTPAAPSTLAAPVRMKAPNGQVSTVPADQVDHFKSLGAVVVP